MMTFLKKSTKSMSPENKHFVKCNEKITQDKDFFIVFVKLKFLYMDKLFLLVIQFKTNQFKKKMELFKVC